MRSAVEIALSDQFSPEIRESVSKANFSRRASSDAFTRLTEAAISSVFWRFAFLWEGEA